MSAGAAPGRVVLGTSGYSFPDWVGPFYPPGTRPGDFLRVYAQHFDAVEVNATYYRMPSADAIARMERRTPDGFRFVVKLLGAFTHERVADAARAREFLAGIEPLRAAGKYEGLLAQFPWAFRRDAAGVAHLAALRERFPDEPLFAEFRHDSWAAPGLAELLGGLGIGYCAVDEPALPGLMPPIAPRTTADAYVRFHGRNAANWWGRGGGDRYDHAYTERELGEWVTRIGELARQARTTYVFFNNCHAGQAARSAKLMQELLRRQGTLAP